MTKEGEAYDDVLPVSLHCSSDGTVYLLDRHNDVLAYFDSNTETTDAQRLVGLINAAWAVVEQFKDFSLVKNTASGQWCASTRRDVKDAVYADTAPLAICLAALKAMRPAGQEGG